MTHLLVAKTGHVTTLTLNRPHRLNAMTPTMFTLMEAAWKDADADPTCHVLIVTGAGGNFSSGMDLRALAGDPAEDDNADSYDNAQLMRADLDLTYRALLKSWRPTKPVIAAVEGVAIAGGTELLLGTDIRVAGASARFGVSEARWSIYPAAGSAVRLPRQIPFAAAAEMLLTGRHIRADEAYRLGLIGQLVEDGGALAAAQAIAAKIAANGPLAVRAILRTLRETAGMTEIEAFQFEAPLADAVNHSDDASEGPLAFAEKRAPAFRGS